MEELLATVNGIDLLFGAGGFAAGWVLRSHKLWLARRQEESIR